MDAHSGMNEESDECIYGEDVLNFLFWVLYCSIKVVNILDRTLTRS